MTNEDIIKLDNTAQNSEPVESVNEEDEPEVKSEIAKLCFKELRMILEKNTRQKVFNRRKKCWKDFCI